MAGAAASVPGAVDVAGFVSGWGIRFRLVGITTSRALFVAVLSAFAISYNPPGAGGGAVHGTDRVRQTATTWW